MNPAHQAPSLLTASNPFARGYDNLHIERLLLITYVDDCPPCFHPVHDSQAHLGSSFLMNSNAFSFNTTRLESTFSLNRSFTSCQVLH